MATDRIMSKMGNRKQRRGVDYEAKLVKTHGGKAVPGSGNKAVKGDIKNFLGDYRLEAKTTARASFSISLKKWQELEESALNHGETPSMHIVFYDDHGVERASLAVIPFIDFVSLVRESGEE